MTPWLRLALCGGISFGAHYAALRMPLAAEQDPPPVGQAPLHLVLSPAAPEPPEPAVTRPVDSETPRPPEPPPEEALEADAPVVIDQQEIEAATESYWSDVRRAVAVHLRYPLSARRARLEDVVTVAMAVGPDGQLLGAEVEGASARHALARATLRAVHAAAPFPPPPEMLAPPLRATLPIRFELGD